MLTVSATDYTRVGVKVGDTADYTYSNPIATGTLATGGFHIEILQVNGTNVTFDLRCVYLNNSQGPDIKQTSNITDYSLQQELVTPHLSIRDNILIAANLSTGNNINYSAEYYPAGMAIDWTITMYVAGHYRAVNHAQHSGEIPTRLLLVWGETWSYSYEAYYDKITGLLVEADISVTGPLPPYGNGTKESLIETLTSTTAFTNSTDITLEVNPTITLPMIVNTAIIAVVAVTMVAAAITSARILWRRPDR
jgi:hypothetical protein